MGALTGQKATYKSLNYALESAREPLLQRQQAARLKLPLEMMSFLPNKRELYGATIAPVRSFLAGLEHLNRPIGRLGKTDTFRSAPSSALLGREQGEDEVLPSL